MVPFQAETRNSGRVPSYQRKIMVVMGTRPEAIKLAPVIKAFERRRGRFALRICVTAQHRQMLDQVSDLFGITPDYDLNIMSGNQDLFEITSRALNGVEIRLDQGKTGSGSGTGGYDDNHGGGAGQPFTCTYRLATWRPACAPMIRPNLFRKRSIVA